MKVENETYAKCAELHPPHPGDWTDLEMPANVTEYIIAHLNKPKDDPPEVRAYFQAHKNSRAAHDASRDVWLEENGDHSMAPPLIAVHRCQKPCERKLTRTLNALSGNIVPRKSRRGPAF
ncbi:hypothetical protein [Mesorhizobium sp. WSM3862]|uniref:hypothetical protein n=1 Tax=Mesorhizobium sp. WSM3862 TaxID=632858 RepID=UPI0011410E3E|nr:hypothetical protein [Mesorhizobium sp. WSM3862]